MPELDAEGFLVDPNDWTEAVADELARSEGIVLGDEDAVVDEAHRLVEARMARGAGEGSFLGGREFEQAVGPGSARAGECLDEFDQLDVVVVRFVRAARRTGPQQG